MPLITVEYGFDSRRASGSGHGVEVNIFVLGTKDRRFESCCSEALGGIVYLVELKSHELKEKVRVLLPPFLGTADGYILKLEYFLINVVKIL